MHHLEQQEVVDAFAFLGKEEAEKIVIKNTHQINQMIEEVSPLQDKLYTPSIEGADEEVRELTYQTAKSIYGEQLPEIVTERLERSEERRVGKESKSRRTVYYKEEKRIS